MYVQEQDANLICKVMNMITRRYR